MKQTIILPFDSMPQPRPQLKRNGTKAHYGSQKFLDFKAKLTNMLRCTLTPVVDEYPIYIFVKYHVTKLPQSDIDNHLKILVDCLVQSGILIDDNMNYVHGMTGVVVEDITGKFEVCLTTNPLETSKSFFH